MGTAVVCAVGLAGVGALALQGDEPARLAGAELIGGGGEQMLRPLAVGSGGEDVALDDVQLDGATLLAADVDGSFLVLAEGADSAVVRSSADGGSIEVGFAAPLPGLTAGSPDAAADLALGSEGKAVMALAGGEVLVLTFGWNTIQDFDARFPPSAVALTDDDTVLVGSVDDVRIDAVAVDDTVRHVVGPPDDPAAEAQWEGAPGPIVALQPLTGGRVAFVVGAGDGPRLYLAHDGQVRPIAPDDPQLARGAEPAGRAPHGERAYRLPVEPLAAGPDGRLLVTGLGPEGDPRISLVDVDTGEIEVLADLEGVEPTVERPVSAAAVGDDLVFLADGRVWKLEGAFAG